MLEIILVSVLLVLAIFWFVTERFPADQVAMMVLTGLMVPAVLASADLGVSPDRWPSLGEVFAGFSNPATVTVAAMFILSSGLQRTGALGVLGGVLTRLGRTPGSLTLWLMLSVGLVSAFVNNTAAVAVFLPLVLGVCARQQIAPARVLIPLSFASQFGGVCTLMGTSTNLLVHSISLQSGHGGFSMFEMLPLGAILMAVGTLYFLFFGAWLLPRHKPASLTEAYQLEPYLGELRVMDKSPLIGKTILESRFSQHADTTVLEIIRSGRKIWAPLHEPVQAQDVLLVRGRLGDLLDIQKKLKLEAEPEFHLADEALESDESMLAQVLIPPRSSLLGTTLKGLNFRRRYNAIVLAMQRRGHSLRDKISEIPIRLGDTLLLRGHRQDVSRLRNDPDFIVLGEVESQDIRMTKVPVALAIVASVVTLAALDVLPVVVSACIGCMALLLTRCIRMDEVYRSVDWKVIFLLAGLLPLGTAMERSGASEQFAQATIQMSKQVSLLVSQKIGSDPMEAVAYGVLAALFLLTTLLTSVMSNNAAAVLLAPLALQTAQDLGVDPRPLLFAVMFAASTCFATPVGYQTNLMVYQPGGYRFSDFMRVGIPLNLVFMGICVVFIPIFWPFLSPGHPPH